MSTLVSLVVAVAGLSLIALGLAFFIAIRFALRGFDRVLSSEVAGYGREQVERVALKIGNPLVRRIVLKHLVATGGTIAVSVARGAIESRMRIALSVAITGGAVFFASFYVGKYLSGH
jgi:hypothetical protein